MPTKRTVLSELEEVRETLIADPNHRFIIPVAVSAATYILLLEECIVTGRTITEQLEWVCTSYFSNR